MSGKEPPKIVDKTSAEIEAAIDDIEASNLSSDIKEFATSCVRLSVWLPDALLSHKISLSNLCKLVFGQDDKNHPRREKPKNDKKQPQKEKLSAASTPRAGIPTGSVAKNKIWQKKAAFCNNLVINMEQLINKFNFIRLPYIQKSNCPF